jgi:hypothetical protein
MKIVSRFEEEIKQALVSHPSPSRIGNYSEGFLNVTNKQPPKPE